MTMKRVVLSPVSCPRLARASTPCGAAASYANGCNMAGGFVYIMTNRPNGTLYVGVTGNLGRRVHEHRSGAVPGFTNRYGLKLLVYVEDHPDIRLAIQREKILKHWTRARKVRLIMGANPGWDDLYHQIM